MADDQNPKSGGVVVGTSGAKTMRVAEALGAAAFPGHRNDPVAARPCLEGDNAAAWTVDLAKARATIYAGRADGGVAAWVIHAPWAHPVWHSYILLLLHLRPVAGFPPAVVHQPGATHEFHLYALDPDEPTGPVVAGDAKPAILTPGNFGAQLIAESDAAAVEKIEAEAIGPIVRHELSPDTDFFSEWVRRFGSSLVKEGF